MKTITKLLILFTGILLLISIYIFLLEYLEIRTFYNGKYIFMPIVIFSLAILYFVYTLTIYLVFKQNIRVIRKVSNKIVVIYSKGEYIIISLLVLIFLGSSIYYYMGIKQIFMVSYISVIIFALCSSLVSFLNTYVIITDTFIYTKKHYIKYRNINSFEVNCRKKCVVINRDNEKIILKNSDQNIETINDKVSEYIT